MTEKDKISIVLSFRSNENLHRDILSCLQGMEDRDSTALLESGRRYTPKALRFLILTSLGEVLTSTDEEFEVPNQYQFAENLILFGYGSGLLSKLEKNVLQKGYPVVWNLSKNDKDATIRSDHNEKPHICGSVESLAAKVAIVRQINPDSKFVLFHGKWNVPHIGYLAFMHDSLNEIEKQYGVSKEHLKPLIVGERNRYISSTGKWVYMNTDWRMSMMSYIPGIFGVAPSGDINIENVQEFWRKKYEDIRPDFLPVEIGDPVTDRKKENAQPLGIQLVRLPSLLGKSKQRSITSSALVDGSLDDETFEEACVEFEKRIGNNWNR